MRDGLIISLLSVVPKNHTTRLMGATSRLGLSRLFIRLFAWKYKINLDECVGGPGDYSSLSDFFLRPLIPEARPTDATPDVLVSPADARVHTFGRITNGTFAQSDTRSGSIANLVGAADPRTESAPPMTGEQFEGGHYAVLYLSPQDYHRVHAPREGTLVRTRYLPGRLWPVFPTATRRIDGLFDRNERLIFQVQTDRGLIASAMIGAFGVGRMTSPHSDIITNIGGAARDVTQDTPPTIDRAAELGSFGLGSTVILLLPPGDFTWELTPGAKVEVGQAIGRWA
ncbi:MAG: phosphatidylserine decarboxylase [Myxococcota bacterium]|jgi:phosphatidylserine decarboxylase